MKRLEVVETRQEKREGINLINVEKLEAITRNGVQATPHTDGSITIVGTATAGADYTLRTGPLPLGTYTYRCFGLPSEIASNIWFHEYCYGEATEKLIADIEDRDYTIKIKIPANTTINATIRPMLVEGEYADETFPDFEAYGVMPSLQYPSEIEAVGDNVQLLEIVNSSVTRNGITFTVTDEGVLANGTATADAGFALKNIFTKYEKGEYHLSGCPARWFKHYV